MAEIICVRHGQASFGADNYDQLSERGYLQARLLGIHLSQAGTKLNKIISGSLQRQLQTAQGVIEVYQEKGLEVPEVCVDERWNELEAELQIKAFLPVLCETRPELDSLRRTSRTDSKSLQKLLEASFRYWVEENPEHELLESWKEAQSRIKSALKSIADQFESGATTAVFSSGGTISIAASGVLGLPDTHVYPLFEQLLNASMTKLIYTKEKVTLKSFNEHAYLEVIGSAEGHSDVISFR